MLLCYSEKATPARYRPERQHNACANRRKQCSPEETKSYSNPTPQRKIQNNPTNSHTPRRMKPTHTCPTYTRMRPHVPSHQAGDHPVPAHKERHNPPKLWTQRQSGLPPRAVRSQGQRHRCRSSRKQSVWGSQAGGRELEEAVWGGVVRTARPRREPGHRSAQAVPRPPDDQSDGHATVLWRGPAS